MSPRHRWPRPGCVCLAFAGLMLFAGNSFGLGEARYVETAPISGGFALVDEAPAMILVDTNDWAGVVRAAGDLRTDIGRVTGRKPLLAGAPGPADRNAVIVGTIGKSRFIDRLILEKKVDASPVAGRWESFSRQLVSDPLPGVTNALVICGSDKRGTIYGIYDLSEQIGVSPWHFWGDVPPKRHARLFVKDGRGAQGPPAVKYRGIFLNDEYPALTRWVQAKYGGVRGHKHTANYGRGFYTNLFELMLRVRANYLWPAMWNNAFNEDDPENPRLADEYGIVMGTSHQEPMLRAQLEWDRALGREYGNWNYGLTNQQPVLQQFWREGVRRNRKFESIFTLGLRAENDSGAPVGKELTEEIVAVQRRILGEEIDSDLGKVPQLWCLYKEVQDYYADGLRVPDDVTLLWAEDNWGNVRRLPTAAERGRQGGAGIYYHFDYHGGPRSYQWINTSPIPKIWDQMSLAKQYGADRIWIVNVGHFKGYEFPIEFFMRLAWDTDRWTHERLDEFTRLWAEREFGPEHAAEIAELISTYTRYNGRRKPELLDASTYSLVHYQEFERVVAEYEALAARAEVLQGRLPPESRDAFYGLVQFPIKACAQLNALYFAAARNALYARQGRASANDYAERTRALFAAQLDLMRHFNRVFAGGKWNHFMDQAHIGYTSWNDPPSNSLHAVKLTTIQVPEPAAMGIGIEGSTAAWPDTSGPAQLPRFDALQQQRRFVDVFNKGKTPFRFTAAADARWIVLSETQGLIEKEKRVWVSIDWGKAPPGVAPGTLKFSGAGREVVVKLETFRPAAVTRDSLQGFAEGDGCVSIEAEHYTAKIDQGASRWIRVAGYGHTLSAMRADAPPDARCAPGNDSPCLEYTMHLFSAGSVQVEAIVGTTLNFLPGRPLQYAVSFDDKAPQVVTVVPAHFNAYNGNREWEESVKNNCRRTRSTHVIDQPGYHTLKIWMVDPGVALQKIVVHTGPVRPSYLGPPESFHNGSNWTTDHPRQGSQQARAGRADERP